jgi:hypothetical protein
MQDRISKVDENSCTARPDYTSGSKCEELSASKSGPGCPIERTSIRRVTTSPWGQNRTIIAEMMKFAALDRHVKHLAAAL